MGFTLDKETENKNSEIIIILINTLIDLSGSDQKLFNFTSPLLSNLLGFLKREQNLAKFLPLINGKIDFVKATRLLADDEPLKELFFKICILAACSDGALSEGELNKIAEYAERLQFPLSKRNEIIKGYLPFFKRKETSSLVNLVKFYLAENLVFLETGNKHKELGKWRKELYLGTDGRFNEFMSELIGLLQPPYLAGTVSGILGRLTRQEANDIAAKLDQDGIYISPKRLPSEVCSRLFNFAMTTRCYPRYRDENGLYTTYDFSRPGVLFDKKSLISLRYDFNMQTLIENPDIQKLAADESLTAVAQKYFKAKPVINIPKMWINTGFYEARTDLEELSRAAQLFHFDLDTLKFLKIFIYLTDVNEKSGPHTYVTASHQNKPVPLRQARRFLDSEIFSFYRKGQIREITAPKGSVIIADTRGFHKGKPVEKDFRLVLQLQFANDLFGLTPYQLNVNEHFSEEFIRNVKSFPHTYSLFKLQNVMNW